MNENRVLVLMAGGYPAEAVPKHLLSVKGLPLFERIINAVPTKNVWVVINKVNYTFWSNWLTEALITFQDKRISLFVEGNKLGIVTNPALWMTSGVPSLTMNLEIKEVVFSAIDTYFDNFNFMDEFMAQDHAVVVAHEKDTLFDTKDVVALDWRGRLKEWRGKVVTSPDDWLFADMMKTTTNNLLVAGQMQKGSMGSVAGTLFGKGTNFKVVKAGCAFIDCGTQERLDKAKHLLGVETKGMVV